MTVDEARAQLSRAIAAELGDARAAELADQIQSTAEALALVLKEPVPLDGEDPDFSRPPA